MILDKHYKYQKFSRERTNIKKRIARRAQQLLYISGIANLYASLHQDGWALILMYHSVVDDQIAPFIDPENSITAQEFESQLILLHKTCRIISLSELLACLHEKKPIAPKTVVITFDDGYLDNLVNVAPLLAKYRMPATLFLATRYIELAEPQWIDRLYNIFQFRSRDECVLACLDESFDLSEPIQLRQAYGQLKKKLLAAGFEERKGVLGQVEEQLEPSSHPPRLTLNWDDVHLLKDKFPMFEIGIHTKNHVDLTSLHDKEAEYEIGQSRQDCKNELGCEPKLFSYPYGRHNSKIRTCVKKFPFWGAVSTQPTYRVNGSTDRWALPRFAGPGSLLDLKVWLSGAFPELAVSLWGKAWEH